MGLPGIDRARVSAEEDLGVRLGRRVLNVLGFHMTSFARAFALVRSLLADSAGGSSIRYAVMIGLSASAVLVLVRVGTAVAAAH